MHKTKIKIRGYLEMEDGNFCTIESILKSPERQARCSEQRELQKIMRLSKRRGIDASALERARQEEDTLLDSREV